MNSTDTNTIIATIDAYAHQALALIELHPSLLIPGVIIIGVIVNALFDAVRSAMVIVAVLAVSAMLAGVDYTGILHHAADAASAVQQTILQQ